MDSAQTTAQVHELEDFDREPNPPRARKLRKARDPERRRLEAEAEAVRRELRKALRDKDSERLAELRAASRRREPDPEQEGPTQPAGPAAAPAAAEPMSSPHPRGPSWPSVDAIAEMAPLVAAGVAQLAPLLEGTRYSISGKRTVKLGDTTVDVDPQATLVQGLAPLAAKYLPTTIATPEGAAVLCLFMVFGAPAFAHALEMMRDMRREQARAAGAGISVGAPA